MLYETVLIAHLITAAITGLIASYALVALWNQTTHIYRSIAIALALFAAFEVLSGTTLSVLSPTVTALSLCTNIVVYLSAVLVVEALLFFRMRATFLSLPLTSTLSPVASSLFVFMGAVTFGF